MRDHLNGCWSRRALGRLAFNTCARASLLCPAAMAVPERGLKARAMVATILSLCKIPIVLTCTIRQGIGRKQSYWLALAQCRLRIRQFLYHQELSWVRTRPT